MQSNIDIVTIDILIHANLHNVWDAWTKPVLILQWFGSDPNGWGISAETDLRIGGRFEVTFSNSDRAEHTCSGIYQQIIKFDKLEFTWTWKSEPGVESLVNVELKADGNYTQMHFEHSRLGQGSAHNYQEGWTSTFEKLDRLVEHLPCK